MDDYGAWLPNPDPTKEKAELEARQNIKASVPVIQEVIDWFDAEIAKYADPRTIDGVNIATNPELVKQAVLFAQTLATAYQDKRDEFQQRFSEYLISEVEQTE